MKSRFRWYLAPDQGEIDEIWQLGELTVDANVLLDLYRYHENTRESIISALESFSTRAWLSDQAAQEFFRNRKAVIATADKDFREGVSTMEEMKTQSANLVARLKGNRLLNRDDIDKLDIELKKVIDASIGEVSVSRKSHPNYLKEDAILERLLKIFDGKVGDSPQTDVLEALTIEGEARIKGKIPPGYLDDSKDEDRKFGDFFLWRQTLDHAKALEKPIILVTSERKDDWWEKHLGKTVGPRPELMRESYEYSGQRVLIYQTEYFLELFSLRSGHTVSPETVSEIREVNARRPTEPAVRVRQSARSADVFENSGTIEIELLRPVYTLTGTGRLDPNFIDKATTTVKLINAPDGVPALSIGSGSGTTYNFNVHIKSNEAGVRLPVGLYVVEYESSVWDEIIEHIEPVDVLDEEEVD